MTGSDRRAFAYVAIGAVGTLVVIVVTLFLLKEGLDTSSKVAGIVGLFVSILMAVWTVHQAKRARRQDAIPGDAPRPSSGPSPQADVNPTITNSGSKYNINSINDVGVLGIGDHMTIDARNRRKASEPEEAE
jgi:hypothetical protein